MKRTHSSRIKKYEIVYQEYVRNKSKSPPRRVEMKQPKEHIIKSSNHKHQKKQTLNSYQKFVQEESLKDKYRKLSGKERMANIATAWEKKKREMRRKERKTKEKGTE